MKIGREASRRAESCLTAVRHGRRSDPEKAAIGVSCRAKPTISAKRLTGVRHGICSSATLTVAHARFGEQSGVSSRFDLMDDTRSGTGQQGRNDEDEVTARPVGAMCSWGLSAVNKQGILW